MMTPLHLITETLWLFQATIQKDPDLPSYVDELAGPDWEGLVEVM